MKISIYAPDVKERFETARQHSFWHPERMAGNTAGIGFRASGQAGGSMLIRSFTADRIRCLQPR
jgi:hypothetical protein